VLKLPIETKLQPVLGALTTLGLTGGQVADLLRSCPQLLAQSKDGIVSRWDGHGAAQQQICGDDKHSSKGRLRQLHWLIW
jgi:hypothetical protein